VLLRRGVCAAGRVARVVRFQGLCEQFEACLGVGCSGGVVGGWLVVWLRWVGVVLGWFAVVLGLWGSGGGLGGGEMNVFAQLGLQIRV